MNHRSKLWVSFAISLCFTLLFSKAVFALPFGIFEPRSLAMGGAGVAAATGENAVFYNPAILSTYKQYKEKADNESFSFPVVAVRASHALETLADQRNVDYASDVNSSIGTFNADPTAQNAQSALNDINSLNNLLSEVASNPLMLDANASLVVGIPSKYQGGAFFVSQRGVGDGQLNIPAADLALLSDYQEELLYASSGGSQGTHHPELYNGGNLIDPSGSITSEANARAVVLSELGISMSKQLNLLGSDFSLGLSVKMVKVTTYTYQRSLTSNIDDQQGTSDDKWHPNMDFGILKQLGPAWRVGLVAKNLIKRSYATASGEDIIFKPQWRLGVAHLTPALVYTLDLDLQRNEGVYKENSAQYLLAGVEIPQGILRYRLGYRHTLAHSGPKETGIFSAGLGLDLKPVYMDFAYSDNHEQRAASLMFGFNF